MTTLLLCALCFVLGWRFPAFMEGYTPTRRNGGTRRQALLVGLAMALHIGIGVQ